MRRGILAGLDQHPAVDQTAVRDLNPAVLVEATSESMKSTVRDRHTEVVGVVEPDAYGLGRDRPTRIQDQSPLAFERVLETVSDVPLEPVLYSNIGSRRSRVADSLGDTNVGVSEVAAGVTLARPPNEPSRRIDN